MPEAGGEPALAVVAVIIDGIEAGAEPETPETFLKEVALALKGTADIDTDLAAILSDQLLTVSAAEGAVAAAKAQILTLAANRAAPAELAAEETGHG